MKFLWKDIDCDFPAVFFDPTIFRATKIICRKFYRQMLNIFEVGHTNILINLTD